MSKAVELTAMRGCGENGSPVSLTFPVGKQGRAPSCTLQTRSTKLGVLTDLRQRPLNSSRIWWHSGRAACWG